MTSTTASTSVLPPDKSARAFGVWWALRTALVCLVFSLVAFSPRLWILASPTPGSTYWDRGLHFIAQVDQPLGSPAEPALVWRLAPVLLAKALHLHGGTALIVPWLGLMVMLTLTAHLARRELRDPRSALLFTALVASTNATLTVTGWLGLNDAWFAAALLVVSFVRPLGCFGFAVLVGPWIDERFVLALPLALWIRHRTLGGTLRLAIVWAAAGLTIYAATRLTNPFAFAQHNVGRFASAIGQFFFVQWLPWAPLGWFMGLRAAWALVFCAWFRADFEHPKIDWLLASLTVAPLCVITILASDTGRAPTMLLPLLLFGAQNVAVRFGEETLRRGLLVLVLANALLPAMHVTHKNADVINSLPLELVRLWKNH